MCVTIRRTLLTAAALLLVLFSPVYANLIVNGSFEAPDIPTGTFAVFGSIPGWDSTIGSGIEIQDNVAGSPFDGAQHIELDSFNNSNIRQTTIPTVASQTYDFSFAYSPRPGRSASDNGIDAFFDGALLISLATSGFGLPDTSWSIFNFAVTATGPMSTVEFLATGPSTSFGGYLDAVSFQTSPVPEPSTWLLLGSGLVGLAFYSWRKRKQEVVASSTT